MGNNELIEYNLSKISTIDKEIEENNKEKNKLIDYYDKRYNKYLFFNKLLSKNFQAIFISILTIVVFILVMDSFYTILITLNILSFVNIIINMLVNVYEIEESYVERLESYNKKNDKLLLKRNSYINLYNYSVYGESALYNNIRLRINNEKFYEYEKYIPNLDLDKDSYEINTLNYMKHQEELLKNSIKNKVYWELNSLVKTEKLTNEQLKLIDLAL